MVYRADKTAYDQVQLEGIIIKIQKVSPGPQRLMSPILHGPHVYRDVGYIRSHTQCFSNLIFYLIEELFTEIMALSLQHSLH